MSTRTAVRDMCPACSGKTKQVGSVTVRSSVRPELVDEVREESYRFCAAPGCDVVYFSETDPAHRFLRSDLRVPVGQKQTTGPSQVCYCFDWRTDDIERELHLTGSTTVPERIKRLVQLGFCRCETMNPQGSCCLGNVHRAVKEAQARLLGHSTDDIGPPHSDPEPSAATRAMLAQKPPGALGAFLAALGGVVTAILGSACCWLPLLLIAFGFSAAGVGSFFEHYRPYLLLVAFLLLGAAWYFSYRTAIRRAWARLRGKPAPTPNGAACCATESATDACCVRETQDAAGQAVYRRSRLSQLNQLMLWVATAIILISALFPHWIGLFFGASHPTALPTDGDRRHIVLEIEGMTCEACAVHVQKRSRACQAWPMPAWTSAQKKHGWSGNRIAPFSRKPCSRRYVTRGIQRA